MKNEVSLLLDLRALRKEAGMSAEEVAEQSGISAAGIERIEWKECPSLANALRLARLLHLSVEDIWALTDEKGA